MRTYDSFTLTLFAFAENMCCLLLGMMHDKLEPENIPAPTGKLLDRM